MELKERILYPDHPRNLKGDKVELEISLKQVADEMKELKILLVYNSRIQGRVVPSFFGESIWNQVIQVVDKLNLIFDELQKTGIESSIDLTKPKINIPTTKRNTYSVTDGKKTITDLPMRRAVLESIKLYILNNRTLTSQEIIKKFNSTDLPSSSYDLIKTYSAFKSWHKEKTSSDPRYFVEEQDRILIEKDNQEIVVCTQWTKESFEKYIKYIKKYNININ